MFRPNERALRLVVVKFCKLFPRLGFQFYLCLGVVASQTTNPDFVLLALVTASYHPPILV